MLWVGNAKQASTFYCSRFGFREVAYRGLETGDREYCCHVIQQDRIVLVLKSPLNPGELEINGHLAKHGDGVKDVAFGVEDCKAVFEYAKEKGAVVVKEPWEEKDENGAVIMATIKTVVLVSNC